MCDALPQALFFRKNGVPGICMPCVCVMHCRRRFFFRKSDVPGIFMPCVCVMHCRRRFFVRKKWRSWDFYALCVCDALPQAFFFGKNDVPEICMPCNSPVEVFLRAAGAFSPGKQ